MIGGAIGQALSLPPSDDARSGTPAKGRVLILFSAEQGFTGSFTDRILDAAAPLATGAAVFLIGSRGAMLSEQRRLQIAWQTTMAPHMAEPLEHAQR